MTKRFSTGLKNFITGHGSFKRALQGGKMLIYSGTQPSSADSAPTGTLLVTITDAAGSHTAEVLATGSVELTGGASGSVNSITVNGVEILPGAVSFNTSLTQTAADVAAAINRHQSTPEYVATSSGAIITITAQRGTGAGPNTFAVVSSVTTITKTDTNMSGGVNAANGLKFEHSASGGITKLASQTWSGTAVASGTAGWFRFVGARADSGSADSSGVEVRMDGAVGTSGAELNLNSVSITSGAVQSISSGQLNMPAG